jgi:hypothetical protein
MQREGAFPPAAAQTSVVTDLPDHARAGDLDEGPSPAVMKFATASRSIADPRRGIQSSRSRDVRKLSTTKSATSLPSR